MTLPAPTTSFAIPKLSLEMTYLDAQTSVIGQGVDWNDILLPVSMRRGRGPGGGELTCRVINRWAYAGAGYNDPVLGNDVIAQLERGLISLYLVSPISGGQFRQLVFRGMLQSVEKTYSESENGVTVVFSDWLPVQVYFVNAIQYFLSAGATISAMNDADLWVKDASGTKLYQAGASAKALTSALTDTFTYEPAGSALTKCIESNRAYLADIRYPLTGKTAYIDAVKRGASTRELCHGKVGSHAFASRLTPTVSTIRGSADYSRIVSQITGIGGTKVSGMAVDLTPAWDATKTADVLATPNLLTLPDYADVGRLYRFNGQAYGMDSVLRRGFSGNDMEFKVWGSRSGEPYSELPARASLVNSQQSQNPLAGYRNYSAQSSYQYILLDAPAIYEYYSGGSRRYQFYTLQMQANFNDGLLTETVNSATPKPFAMRRVYRNDGFTSMSVSGVYDRPTGTRAGRQSSTVSSYDTSANFIAQLRDVLATTQDPMQNINVHCWDCDFTWRLGMGISQLADMAGVRTDAAQGWTVEGLAYSFYSNDNKAMSMDIEIAREQSEYLGGMIL